MHLRHAQCAGRVVEELIDRQPAWNELLPVAEVDDDFQYRAARLDAEAIWIEFAAIAEACGQLALVQLAEDILSAPP